MGAGACSSLVACLSTPNGSSQIRRFKYAARSGGHGQALGRDADVPKHFIARTEIQMLFVPDEIRERLSVRQGDYIAPPKPMHASWRKPGCARPASVPLSQASCSGKATGT